MIDAYIKGAMESPDKAYKQLKKVIPDVEAVIEKIIKPSIEGSKTLFKPDALTRRITKIKDSFKPTRAEMERRAQKYLKRLKYAFRHKGKEYAKIMKVMSDLWGKAMTRFVLPFRGFGDKIRGVGPVASRWLTGILTVLKKIKRKKSLRVSRLILPSQVRGVNSGIDLLARLFHPVARLLKRTTSPVKSYMLMSKSIGWSTSLPEMNLCSSRPGASLMWIL